MGLAAVAGTCGKSCGEQGCASIGSPSTPAGKQLGDPHAGSMASGLEYELYTTPDGRLYLHDNNIETIDYGSSPKAATNFMTVPVDPGASSIYHTATFSAAGDMLVAEAFTNNGVLLKRSKDKKGEPSYGHAKKLITKEQLTGTYLESQYPNGTDVFEAQGIPMQWNFIQNDKKVLALVSYASPRGGAFFDHAFVEFDVE